MIFCGRESKTGIVSTAKSTFERNLIHPGINIWLNQSTDLYCEQNMSFRAQWASIAVRISCGKQSHSIFGKKCYVRIFEKIRWNVKVHTEKDWLKGKGNRRIDISSVFVSFWRTNDCWLFYCLNELMNSKVLYTLYIKVVWTKWEKRCLRIRKQAEKGNL